MLTLFTAAAVLAACAGLRWFLNRPERKDAFFWGGRIRLTALWNDGAAFSLPLKRKLVTALSILILPLVWVFRRRSPIGAGLALGGGLSNLWERLRRGAVYDYVQFPKLPKIGRYARRNILWAALFWTVEFFGNGGAGGQDLAGAESSVRGAKR